MPTTDAQRAKALGTYTAAMGGKKILDELTSQVGSQLGVIRSSRKTGDITDFEPVEQKRAKRDAAVAIIRRHIGEAERAFNEWAGLQRADAERVMATAPGVGSAAEETRRLRDDMEVDRLVAAGLASGAPLNRAKQLAAEAEQAYMRVPGDYERAVVLARAASTLSPGAGDDIRGLAQTQIDLADPAKAAAHRTLATLKLDIGTFTRDANRLVAQAFESAAEHAASLGDDPREFTRTAAQASLAHKVAAAALAQATETVLVTRPGIGG